MGRRTAPVVPPVTMTCHTCVGWSKGTPHRTMEGYKTCKVTGDIRSPHQDMCDRYELAEFFFCDNRKGNYIIRASLCAHKHWEVNSITGAVYPACRRCSVGYAVRRYLKWKEGLRGIR